MLPLPLVTPLDDGENWLLEADYIHKLNDGRTLFIPKGFVFDFASVPRFAWRLFPPATGKHRIPALIHDWLCASGHVSWSEAANLFLDAMKCSGTPTVSRYTIYSTVRAYGPFHHPDPREHSLRLLQKERIEYTDELYTNII